MDSATPVIENLEATEYGKIVIRASDGKRYEADLTSFSKVKCFPSTSDAWKQASVDSYGLGVVWPTRFEVHIDQIIGLAFSVSTSKSATQ